MKLAALIDALEAFAPRTLQEEYDNSGLLLGKRQVIIDKALICVDITDEVMQEAIEGGFNLLISHHPFIFKGIKRVTGQNLQGRILISAIKHDIAVYAMHTNLDNVFHGVNGILASKLGLTKLKILSPQQGNLRKLVTFCPTDHADQVRNALFEAGAGQIGEYDACSYNVDGQGTFRAGDGANPFVGEKGKLHFEHEVRIETIYPVYLENAIIAKLLAAHPYEEVAYDIYPLSNVNSRIGAGMIGELEKAMSEKTFLEMLKKNLNAAVIRHSSLLGRTVTNVAFCGGSGSFLIQQAISMGADAFITGDMKYHQFFEAENKILIADVGHYESEQFTKELIFQILKKKFPNFALRISKVNTNAVKYFS